MNRILVTGACGQIGSELVPELRCKYGADNVVASGHITTPSEDIKNGGPYIEVDVTDYEEVNAAIKLHKIDTVYHLASILSALAESRRRIAYKVNFTGLNNVLESGVENKLERVMVVSSIGAFGPETPGANTPNETIQKPTTHYGISKVFTELLGNYFSIKLGLDVRGVRLPGIISWKVEPTAGTTDYAVEIFYEALKNNYYVCPLGPDTRLPMMYMPDAISALMNLADANSINLKHHADFNVNSMSFTPSELADAIRKRLPDFRIEYEIDPLRQGIADSWPDKLDDTVARNEWGWSPKFGLDELVDDMIKNLSIKLGVAS